MSDRQFKLTFFIDRPHWDSTTSPEELDNREKAAFLDWRKSLST